MAHDYKAYQNLNQKLRRCELQRTGKLTGFILRTFSSHLDAIEIRENDFINHGLCNVGEVPQLLALLESKLILKRLGADKYGPGVEILKYLVRH